MKTLLLSNSYYFLFVFVLCCYVI